jgi:hypothetical protein
MPRVLRYGSALSNSSRAGPPYADPVCAALITGHAAASCRTPLGSRVRLSCSILPPAGSGAYGVCNIRVGARFGRFDVSAFVQNVGDAAPALELTRSEIYDPQDWQNVTLRPRTYGLTAIWRH